MSDFDVILPKAQADLSDAISDAVLDAIDRENPPNRAEIMAAFARREHVLVREENRVIVRILDLEVTVDLVPIGPRRLDA